MFRRIVAAGFATAVLGAVSAGLVFAVDAESPWLTSASPRLEGVANLPDNTLPLTDNNDCQKITTRFSGSTAMKEACVVGVPYGMAGNDGVVFSGSSEAMAVVPPPGFSGLYPVPGQSLMYTYSSAPIIGMHMHFYRSIYDKLGLPVLVNGRMQYTLNQPPDFSLKDTSGQLLAIKPSTLAFSARGNWMVVDIPYKGIVRINLATFQMTPIAPSLNQGHDYASRAAQISISDDGRYIALKPHDYQQFIVYDVATCAGTSLPVPPGSVVCKFRDYWPFMNASLQGLRAIYQPRFMGSDQLQFKSVYAYDAGKFKVRHHILTAPGVSPTGIDYLGLGDSFAAGQGAYNYVEGTDTSLNACHLSSLSYPFLIGASSYDAGHSVACSGARTNDFLNLSGSYSGQLNDRIIKDKRTEEQIQSAINNFTPGVLSQTEFVNKYKPAATTLSIGGNDIGFSDILKTCVMPALSGNSCYPMYEDQLEKYTEIQSVFNKLVSSYSLVKNPGKRVYVLGYPQVAVSGGDCAANVNLDAKEIDFSIKLIDYLNAVIRQAAAKAGVEYVDMSESLAGHRMCETHSAQVAVNGFTVGNDDGLRGIKLAGDILFVGAESYHPNAFGHDLQGRFIAAATNNLQKPMPPPDPAAAPPPVPSLMLSTMLPRSNRPVRATLPSDTMTEDLLLKGRPAQLDVDVSTALLKPSDAYSVELHSTPVSLGTFSADAAGELHIEVTIPSTVDPGFHVLHILGQNLAGQPVDIYKTVYVATSAEDYNGDGVPNNMDPCVILAASGQDFDGDSIDDACDPVIAEPTATARFFQVSLSGNTVRSTKEIEYITNE